jgi:hypothetical protein
VGCVGWAPAAYHVGEEGGGSVAVGAIIEEKAVAHINIVASPNLTITVVGSKNNVAISSETVNTTVVTITS